MVSTLSVFKLRVSKLAILLGDVVAMAAAFILSIWVLNQLGFNSLSQNQAWWGAQEPNRLISWFFISLLGLVLMLMKFQHYSDRRPFWGELFDFARLIGLLSLLDIAIVAMMQWKASRLWWVLSWFLMACLLVVCRVITRRVLKNLQLWTRPTIIIGTGPNAAEAALAISSQPEMGLQIGYFVDVADANQPTDHRAQPRILSGKVVQIAKQPGIQWVIALEHTQAEQREYWLRQLAKWGTPDVAVIPAMRGVPLHGTDMTHFFSHEVAMLRMRNNLRRWPARLTKRIFDTVTAVMLLILLTPFMLIIAYLIRRDGGPALFAHPRIGQNAAVFNCLKFRTMVVDAEMQLERLLQRRPDLRRQWESDRKLKQDPRISPIGRLLRRTSLDELPQLINVIKGQMSLVGPRPIVRTELKKYGAEVVYYLMVRPGITGLWQVSGRNDVDYETRVYLDTWYVKNWALLTDLKILIQTVGVVFRRDGAY
jgi:Undecaprenyl-phosphate galactose phosphotransferase WbaP